MSFSARRFIEQTFKYFSLNECNKSQLSERRVSVYVCYRTKKSQNMKRLIVAVAITVVARTFNILFKYRITRLDASYNTISVKQHKLHFKVAKISIPKTKQWWTQNKRYRNACCCFFVFFQSFDCFFVCFVLVFQSIGWTWIVCTHNGVAHGLITTQSSC